MRKQLKDDKRPGRLMSCDRPDRRVCANLTRFVTGLAEAVVLTGRGGCGVR